MADRSCCCEVKIDLDVRDPDGINSNLLVKFENVVGEPSHTRSGDSTWKDSAEFYDCCRIGLYWNMTIFCGICIAFHWGVQMALASFVNIWYLAPPTRFVNIWLSHIQKLCYLCLGCILVPICDTCASIFSRIHVTRPKNKKEQKQISIKLHDGPTFQPMNDASNF